MATGAYVEREWVSVRDPDHTDVRYTFDVSFLLSNYRCIYGQGCPGIGGGPDDGPENGTDIGCCLHGAYLNEDDDADELERLVTDELNPSLMQFHTQARTHGCVTTDEDDEIHTRTIDDACIFLNRSDHPAGAGCALHALAMERDEHHMTYKPQVCWQLPLHRTVDEITGNDGETMQIHTIAAYERGHWGAGGADFDWYCTESPDAFIGDVPLYEEMEYELRDMVGDRVYDELVTHLASRRRQRNVVTFLPLA